MKKQLRDILWLLVISLSLLTALNAIKFLQPNPALFHPAFRDKYLASFPILIGHGICAILALVLGLLQFNQQLRNRARKVHRILGRIYIVCIFVAGITGFYLGLRAFGGSIAQISFCLLSLLWIYTGGRALYSAIKKDFRSHQNWIIRNYALTFGAVMFRVFLNSLQAAGFEFETIYPYVTWLGWIPNLLVAEWIIYRQHTSFTFRESTLKPAS